MVLNVKLERLECISICSVESFKDGIIQTHNVFTYIQQIIWNNPSSIKSVVKESEITEYGVLMVFCEATYRNPVHL